MKKLEQQGTSQQNIVKKNLMYVGFVPFDKLMKNGTVRTLKTWTSTGCSSKQGYVNKNGSWDGPVIYMTCSELKFYYYENGSLAKYSPFLRIDDHIHQGNLKYRSEKDKNYSDSPMSSVKNGTPMFRQGTKSDK